MFEYLDFQKFGCGGSKNYNDIDDIIINPMDLTMIKEKIASNEYKWIEECLIDIEWICHNYSVYFHGEHKEFLMIFIEIFQIIAHLGREIRR